MRNFQTKSLFASSPDRIVAALFGLLDASVWVSAYNLDSESGPAFSLYYAFAVATKMATLIVFVRTIRLDHASIMLPFYVPIAVTVLASILMGNTDLEGVIQPIGAIASLISTIVVLKDENVALYMKAFGLSCAMAAVMFLYLLNFVPLDTPGGIFLFVDGRYSFIGGTQPNLGGEIMFTGFVALCVARIRLVWTVAAFALFFTVLYFLESRAAMLSVLIAFVLYVYVEKTRRLALGARLGLVFVLSVVILLVCALNWNKISDLFLLDNEYRGVGTGFVGREDHWDAAWEAFQHSPIFGAGFGYFRHDVVTPHSLWLGMLSMMGLMSIFIVISIVKNGWRVFQTNTTTFLLLASFIPMTIFNDRFLNLNPYPFLFYVLLFLPREALLARSFRRVLRRRFDAVPLQPTRRGKLGEGAR